MPLIQQTEHSVVLHDNGLGLFVAGDAVTTSSSVPPAKKSLNFQNATAPSEQVIVHVTAVHTATNSQNAQETGAMGGGATGTSLQTCSVARHPNVVKCQKD